MNVRQEINFSESRDKNLVFKKIKNIKKINGDTCLGETLDYATRNMLTTAAGSRIEQGIEQIIFVMTDGNHNCKRNMLEVLDCTRRN